MWLYRSFSNSCGEFFPGRTFAIAAAGLALAAVVGCAEINWLLAPHAQTGPVVTSGKWDGTVTTIRVYDQEGRSYEVWWFEAENGPRMIEGRGKAIAVSEGSVVEGLILDEEGRCISSEVTAGAVDSLEGKWFSYYPALDPEGARRVGLSRLKVGGEWRVSEDPAVKAEGVEEELR